MQANGLVVGWWDGDRGQVNDNASDERDGGLEELPEVECFAH